MQTKSAAGTESLLQRLNGIRDVLVAHHAAGAMLPSAAKGSEREVLVRDFLARVFPPSFRFGSGAVVDGSGAESGQLDVVVEFPFFPSFPTPGADERLYLAESVAFVIEVKSNLSKQWHQVEQTAERLRPLKRSWCSSLLLGKDGVFEIGDASESRIPLVTVAFTGHTSVEAVEAQLARTPEGKRPDSVLVIDSGVYVSHLTGVREIGPLGLLRLCTDATYFATNVLLAHANFAKYFNQSPDSV